MFGAIGNTMVSIDWSAVLTGVIAASAVLVAKTLLDFSVARGLVKWVSLGPLRGMFRHKVPDLRGQWRQEWGAARSKRFAPNELASDMQIRQFGAYCYAEFTSGDTSYAMFGRIKDMYLVGEWFDCNDRHAYYGAFQARIVDGGTVEGKYVGHSKATAKIKADKWNWKRQT